MKSFIETIESRFNDAFKRLNDPIFAQASPLVARAAVGKGWDYQANCAMGLAKRAKKNPREVAEQIREYEKAYPELAHPQESGDEIVQQPVYAYDIRAVS